MPNRLSEIREGVKGVFERRDERGDLSKAHDWFHVNSVAQHARITAEELARSEGMTKASIERAGLLAETAGYLHDLRRRATESETPGFEHPALAERFVRMAAKNRSFEHLREGLSDEDIDIVASAIGLHNNGPEDIEKAVKGMSPMHKIVSRAVVLGDKLFEASGHRVIERRSFFVGRERMKGDKGLQILKKEYGDKAPVYAVAMECVNRLRGVKALEAYPDYAKKIAEPLYEEEEKFYAGLLGHLGLTEEELMDEMKRLNFPKFDKYEKKARQRSGERPIRPIKGEVADSAGEIVRHFASRDSAVESIRKAGELKGKTAKKWMEGIIGAREGGEEYLNNVRRALRKGLKN